MFHLSSISSGGEAKPSKIACDGTNGSGDLMTSLVQKSTQGSGNLMTLSARPGKRCYHVIDATRKDGEMSVGLACLGLATLTAEVKTRSAQKENDPRQVRRSSVCNVVSIHREAFSRLFRPFESRAGPLKNVSCLICFRNSSSLCFEILSPVKSPNAFPDIGSRA